MNWTIVAAVLITALLIAVGMNFVGPEKRIERKIEHRYATADPQFRREMDVMMGPAIVPGNSITDLQNGVEIFPAMLEAIAAARTTISFETYIYWSGEIGKQFADALIERARAGVAVSVIIDWAGSVKMEEQLLDELKRSGVRIERYRPLHWYNIGRMNNRTHRKLLVVDGRVAFTGGVGVADHWQGNAGRPRALARHALPPRGSGRGPVPGRVQRQLDQDHRRSAERPRQLPGHPAGGRPSGAPLHQLPGWRQRQHGTDVSADAGVGHAEHRPRGGLLRARRADYAGPGGGAGPRRPRARPASPASTSTPKPCAWRRKPSGGGCSRRASRSTNTSRR